MTDDAELLRRYAEEKSEEAFAELVERHLGLVYHAALRQCGGDAYRAQDVAQAVFADLARKAATLARRPVLAGWLYTSTRYAAAQAVRTEVRRQAREQEAHAMSEILSGIDAEPAADWEQLRPVIDDALHGLGERDREAVLLRFFEGRSFADVSAKLSVSEDAARMRVDRALERMRALLARHGVTSTTTALAAALSSQAVASVPAGLGSMVMASVAASGVVAGGVATTISLMSMSKIGIAGAVVITGATGLWWQHRQNVQLEERVAVLQQEGAEFASMRADNERLSRARAETDVRLAALQTEVTTLKARSPERTRAPAPKVQGPAAVPGDGTVPLVLATGLKPAGNAGTTTPRGAAETIHWAINGGDIATLVASTTVTSDVRERMQQSFNRLPAEKQAEFGTAEQMLANLLSATTQVAGMQIMSERPGAGEGYDPSLADNPSFSTVHIQRQYVDGRVVEQDLVFQQVDGAWRWVVPAGVGAKMGAVVGPRPPHARPDGG